MKHILLLVLSTFPKEYKGNDFAVEGEEHLVIRDCIGQLEPIPEYLMVKHPEDDLHLIILCTKETQQVERRKESDFCGESPLSFFKERLLDYSDEMKLKQPIFHVLPIESEQPQGGIIQAANLIRELSRNEEAKGEKADFFIDAHGGFRDLALIIQAIASLLKVEKISPKCIFGVRYAEGSELHHIVKQQGAYAMFDLVTGMNDFINFGSADVLTDYFSSGTAEEKSVVEGINYIAQGTQLCDPDTYKRGLNLLGKALAAVKTEDPSILSLFKGYITESYGDLLKRETRTTLQIIRHCRDKKLYQQALTFIESAMPEEICRKKIICFDECNLLDPEILNVAAKYNGDRIGPADLFNMFVTMGNLTYFYGNNENNHREAMRQFSKNKKLCLDLLKKPSLRTSFSEVNSFINTAEGCNSTDTFPFDINITRNWVKQGTLKKINSGKSTEWYNSIGLFLRMHRALKDCRNMMNHGKSGRPEIGTIIDVIDLYIAYAEALYQARDKKEIKDTE